MFSITTWEEEKCLEFINMNWDEFAFNILMHKIKYINTRGLTVIHGSEVVKVLIVVYDNLIFLFTVGYAVSESCILLSKSVLLK